MHVLAIDAGSYSIKYVSSFLDRKNVTHVHMRELNLREAMEENTNWASVEEATFKVLERIMADPHGLRPACLEPGLRSIQRGAELAINNKREVFTGLGIAGGQVTFAPRGKVIPRAVGISIVKRRAGFPGQALHALEALLDQIGPDTGDLMQGNGQGVELPSRKGARPGKARAVLHRNLGGFMLFC